MLGDARKRAQLSGVAFDLEEDDIEIPTHCPVFGFPLKRNCGAPGPNSPSLDRLRPERGYVRGNVIVVSNRANILRRDASVKELERLAAFYRKALKKNASN